MPAVKEKEPKAKKKKYSFKVLRGGFVEGKKDQGNFKAYKIGDIIETNRNLLELFGPEKFQDMKNKMYVSEPEKINLDSLTIKELRDVAEEEEIELETATSKKEILSVLKSALDLK